MSMKSRAMLLMSMAAAMGQQMTLTEAEIRSIRGHMYDLGNGRRAFRSGMLSGNGQSRKKRSNGNHVAKAHKRRSMRKKQGKTA